MNNLFFNDKISEVKRIEKLNNHIHCCLFDYTIDEKSIYKEICQRLCNASSTLYANAIRIANNISPSIELANYDITNEDIEKILYFLSKEIAELKTPKDIFDDFFIVLKSYNIYPYFLLKLNKDEIEIGYAKSEASLGFIPPREEWN